MHRLIGLLVLLGSFATGWLWMDYRMAADTPLPITQIQAFDIDKGEGLDRIARKLEARGIIAKPLWFKLLAFTDGTYKRLKHGEYQVVPGMTPRGLLAKIAAGKVRQHPVTLVEGWSFADIRAELARQPVLTPLTAGKSAEDVMAAIGAPGEHPEGRFFPDTYFFSKGTSDLELLRRAYGRLNAVLEQEWQTRDQRIPYATPYQALIAASIVEKETARPDERPLVAGVVARRLAKGMRLQMDPTVIYGLGSGFDGDIRKSDLLRDTPYNTYTRAGLPPTPIAMPGLDAIRAALHPDEGDSLYFVARGDGSHLFSATLEEHQRAVERFQKKKP